MSRRMYFFQKFDTYEIYFASCRIKNYKNVQDDWKMKVTVDQSFFQYMSISTKNFL